MRAPLSWLRDFAPFPDDVGVLRDALDDLGLVVEAIEHVGEGLGDVVVGRVLEIRAIKGADKIRLTIVDGGGAEPLEIVCGATNFEVGDRVPLAPVGAILPGGFEIGQRKLRGVTSNGMLCSGKELGLTDDGAGLLILGDESPGEPGTPIMEALGSPHRHRLRHCRRGQPSRRLVHFGHRPRPGRSAGAALHAARAARARCERPAGGGGGERVGGVGRPLPPPHRLRPARRRRRPLARLDRPAPAAGRHAPDQQRRRRLQLRHARARPAHPPLRPVAPARTQASLCGGPDPARRSRRSTACGARRASRAGAWATPARTASSAMRRARRSASAGSWAAPRRRSPTPRPRCCSRRPTSRRWPSPAPPSAWACARRRRRASSAASTRG